MFKHILLLLLCLSATGCVTTRVAIRSTPIQNHIRTHKSVDIKPPCYEDFLSIYHEDYIVDYNDCSNMSSKYARILREHGHNADLMILYNDDSAHCVVIITYEDGSMSYYDPTNNKWGERKVLLREWTDLFVIPFEERLNRGHDGFKERNTNDPKSRIF